MRYKTTSLIFLLLLTTTLPVYGQPTTWISMPVAEGITSVPTARNFAYPQSIYVDSQHGNIWVTDFSNNRVLRFDASSLTGIAGGALALTAETYTLGQNYPNPFNPSTTIRFGVKNTGHATLTVYTVLGQEVARLFDGTATGHTLYTLSFDATALPSGMYFYALRSATSCEVKMMAVVK